VQQGQEVWQANQSSTGPVILYGPGQEFLGLGEITDAGKIAPKRLVVTAKNLVAALP